MSARKSKRIAIDSDDESAVAENKKPHSPMKKSVPNGSIRSFFAVKSVDKSPKKTKIDAKPCASERNVVSAPPSTSSIATPSLACSSSSAPPEVGDHEGHLATETKSLSTSVLQSKCVADVETDQIDDDEDTPIHQPIGRAKEGEEVQSEISDAESDAEESESEIDENGDDDVKEAVPGKSVGVKKKKKTSKDEDGEEDMRNDNSLNVGDPKFDPVKAATWGPTQRLVARSCVSHLLR